MDLFQIISYVIILKQSFTSGSVNIEFVSVFIHRCSPCLQQVIVYYHGNDNDDNNDDDDDDPLTLALKVLDKVLHITS